MGECPQSPQHPVLFDTNADKMAAAIKDLHGHFLQVTFRDTMRYVVCILLK